MDDEDSLFLAADEAIDSFFESYSASAQSSRLEANLSTDSGTTTTSSGSGTGISSTSRLTAHSDSSVFTDHMHFSHIDHDASYADDDDFMLCDDEPGPAGDAFINTQQHTLDDPLQIDVTLDSDCDLFDLEDSQAAFTQLHHTFDDLDDAPTASTSQLLAPDHVPMAAIVADSDLFLGIDGEELGEVDADGESEHSASESEVEWPHGPLASDSELQTALDDLEIGKPLVFPPDATRQIRRQIVRQALLNLGMSILIQLTLATTLEPAQQELDMQASEGEIETSIQGQAPQQRTRKKKPAKRKPALRQIELRLHNRQSKVAGKTRAIKFPSSLASLKQLDMVLRLADLLTECLEEDGYATLRDLYYRDPKLFGAQRSVDKLVDDIAATLGVRRIDLNVIAASKGLVTGHISYTDQSGNVTDCSNDLTPRLIPPGELIETLSVSPDVRFVMVVEKEAVFQTLKGAAFTSHPVMGKSILITGKGYPDVATRELVRRLCIELPHTVPVFCLVDADPHGLDIYLNYRDGSAAMAFDAENLTAPRLAWLGVSHEDMMHRDFDQGCRLPLSPHDIKKGLALLKRCNEDHTLRKHLQGMMHSRMKAEIQLMGSNDVGGLMRYVERKVLAAQAGAML